MREPWDRYDLVFVCDFSSYTLFYTLSSVTSWKYIGQTDGNRLILRCHATDRYDSVKWFNIHEYLHYSSRNKQGLASIQAKWQWISLAQPQNVLERFTLSILDSIRFWVRRRWKQRILDVLLQVSAQAYQQLYVHTSLKDFFIKNTFLNHVLRYLSVRVNV